MYHENGHSKNKTAAKFNIQTNQLRNWISKKPQLLKTQPGVKRLNIGAKPKYPALETALLTWVKEKRKNQNVVT
jgi:transposase-like protein